MKENIMIIIGKYKSTTLGFKSFYLFTCFIVIAICVGINACKNNEANINNTVVVNETDKWVRHEIATNIKRGNGSMAIGDMNRDGKTDVLICLGRRNTPQPSDGIWWFEAPDWTLRRISDPNSPIRWSLALTTGDIDNDGDMDVVALSFDDSNVYLAINPLNNGGDLNKPWQTIKILESPGIHRDGESVELVDIDNDGYKDVLFPRGRPAEVRVLFNPSGVPTNFWVNKFIGVHGGSDAHDVFYADLDLDGDIDIISASGDQTWLGRVFWYEQPDGDPRYGNWERHLISGGILTSKLLSVIPNSGFLSRLSRYVGYANYGGLQIDDIDKDGRPDVLVTEAHGTPGKVMWFKNPEPSDTKWICNIIGSQNFPHAGLSFDVDGDGRNEYWVPDSSHALKGQFGYRTGGIVYYKLINEKNNEWAKHVVALPPVVGRKCRAVDMDGDGDMDVVSTADHMPLENSMVWWENRNNRK